MEKEQKTRNSQHFGPIVGNPEKQTNFFDAFTHLFKADVGVGLFAMGYAYKNGGLATSVACTIFFGVVCLHCQHLLLRYTEKASLDEYQELRRIEYSDALELCFVQAGPPLDKLARVMARFCDAMIVCTQLGFCCIYLTVIGQNLQSLLENHNITMSVRVLIMISWIPILIVSLITNLKALAPISSMANICLLSSFAIVLYHALKDGLPPISERKLYTNAFQTMTCICVVIFAIEGIGVVIPVKNSMKNPNDFQKPCGVRNLTMLVVVLLYGSCGIFGYLKWGEDVADLVTLNVGEGIFAQCTKVLLILGVWLTYPLQFFVPCSAFAPGVIRKFKCEERPLICELIFRTVISFATLIIAVAFPNIGIFISLVGGVSSTALAIIFPLLMESLALRNTENKCLKYLKHIKNCIILMIAFISIVFGTYVNILDIIKYYKEDKELKIY